MTPTELRVSWRTLAGQGLTPCRVAVRDSLGVEHVLSSGELLDLCAAVELDRVFPKDAAALLARRKYSRKAWTWADLMDGARGLTPSDAPGELSIGECMRRVRLEIVRVDVVDVTTRQRKAGAR